MTRALHLHASPVRVYLGSMVACSVLITLAGVPWLGDLRDNKLFLGLSVLIALTTTRSLKVRPHVKLAIRIVPLIMAATLLAPAPAVLAAGSGVLLGSAYLLSRHQCNRTDLIFNTAQSVMCTALAAVLYQILAPTPPEGFGHLLAVCVGAAGFHLVNLLLVAGVMLSSGQSKGLVSTLRMVIGSAPLQYALLIISGVLGALLLGGSRWAIVPFVLLLILTERMFVALRDDAERERQLAQDNARLYREAQNAVRLRDEFLALAAHELKTPITTLVGSTYLLRHRPANAPLSTSDQRMLNMIGEQSTRLHRLNQMLLDLSHLDIGELHLVCRPLDLGALVQRLVNEFQLTLTQHTVHLVCGPEPVMINGDELRLEQVIDNLLQNARKYSPAGGPILVRVEQRNDAAYLVVRDQGQGIAPAAQQHIFERFYQAPQGRCPSSSGLGLGLYVVKEIVTRHGGDVEVQSTEGRGSTFSVAFPVHSAYSEPHISVHN